MVFVILLGAFIAFAIGYFSSAIIGGETDRWKFIKKNKKEIKEFNELKDSNNKEDIKLDIRKSDLEKDNPFIGDKDDEIKKYFPDMDEYSLIKDLFKIFVDVHKSLMLFDYDSLKDKCSDELYSSYKSDLKVSDMRKEQFITNDYKLVSGNVDEIRKDEKYIVVKLFLHVSYRKCVINTTNNKTIYGDENEYVHDQYFLEFIISNNHGNIKCPSCGSIIKNNEKKCSYCKTIINSNYGNFVLNVLNKL